MLYTLEPPKIPVRFLMSYPLTTNASIQVSPPAPAPNLQMLRETIFCGYIYVGEWTGSRARRCTYTHSHYALTHSRIQSRFLYAGEGFINKIRFDFPA